MIALEGKEKGRFNSECIVWTWGTNRCHNIAYGYHHPIHKTNRTRIYAREAVRLDSRPEQGRDIQRTILHYSLRNREGRLTKFDKKVFSH